MKWIEKLKEAYYRDNDFDNAAEKDEAWKVVERSANIAYRFIREELLSPTPPPQDMKEWIEEVLEATTEFANNNNCEIYGLKWDFVETMVENAVKATYEKFLPELTRLKIENEKKQKRIIEDIDLLSQQRQTIEQQKKQIEGWQNENESDDDEWVKLYANRDYWKQRCEAAEKFIEESPCDPDITTAQIAAHKTWQQLKSTNQ